MHDVIEIHLEAWNSSVLDEAVLEDQTTNWFNDKFPNLEIFVLKNTDTSRKECSENPDNFSRALKYILSHDNLNGVQISGDIMQAVSYSLICQRFGTTGLEGKQLNRSQQVRKMLNNGTKIDFRSMTLNMLNNKMTMDVRPHWITQNETIELDMKVFTKTLPQAHEQLKNSRSSGLVCELPSFEFLKELRQLGRYEHTVKMRPKQKLLLRVYDHTFYQNGYISSIYGDKHEPVTKYQWCYHESSLHFRHMDTMNTFNNFGRVFKWYSQRNYQSHQNWHPGTTAKLQKPDSVLFVPHYNRNIKMYAEEGYGELWIRFQLFDSQGRDIYKNVTSEKNTNRKLEITIFWKPWISDDEEEYKKYFK